MPDFERIRQHRRVSLNCLVGVSCDKNFVFEHSLEISEGGMLLTAASQTYTVGEIFELSFKLPYSQPLNLQGEVIYILNGSYGPRQIGIRFVNTRAVERQLIRDYVHRQSTQIY